MSYFEFMGGITKKLIMSLIGFGIIWVGVKVYTFSMKSGSFNNPIF